VFELFKAGRLYDHVVTVCRDSEEKCPLFPGVTRRWRWPFPDPAKVEGADDEKLAEVRRIGDMISGWLKNPPDGAIDYHALIDG
jgi:arsenate reductase